MRTSRFDATLGLSPPSGDTQSSDGFTAEGVFALVPRWSFVDTPTDWAWVGARIAWDVVAVSDDTMTRKPSVAFEDVELDIAYSRTLARTAGGLVLLGGPRLGVALPASPASRLSSVYVRTSVGMGADLHVPIHGGDWLRGAFVSASGTWQHALAAPSSPGGTGGAPAPVGVMLMDQNRFFAGAGIPNGGNVTALLGAWLTIYRDLSLGTAWGYSGGYAKRSTFCSQPLLGCVASPSPSSRPTTIFDVALGYAIADVVWIAVGYDNTNASRLSSSGKRYGVFYSPDARLWLQLSVLADGVFAKAAK